MGLNLPYLEKMVKKLLGKNDIEDALKRLDTLTMEEARMAIAENLKVTNRVDNKVAVLIDGRQNTFLWFIICAILNMDKRTGGLRIPQMKRSVRALSQCFGLSGLIHSHREPVTREIAKVAISSGSLDKP